MSDKQGFLHGKMKARLILPIAAVFIAFVLFGFWAAARLDSPLVRRVLSQKPAETQKNYLLVQVNNLDERSPRVISIWVAFLDRSDSTHLVFMPLFPNSDQKINTRIARSLRMTRDGFVADRTVRKIENRYHIRTDGFVVVDNAALTSLAGDFFDESLAPAVEKPQDAEEISGILTGGKEHFSAFCAQVQQSGSGMILDKVDWDQILPAHLKTNLTFEELMHEIQSFKQAGQVQTCEVIKD